MGESRASLRVRLARSVGRYFAGTATGGTTATLIDTGGLVRWTETDALKGAYLLIVAAGGAAPEGQSRRIKTFNSTSQTITVDVAFSAAPEAGDSYALYMAPLTLDEWDDCINEAIRGAWPTLYEAKYYNAGNYLGWGQVNVPFSTTGIEEIFKVTFGMQSCYLGQDVQEIPRSRYTVAGAPGGDLTIYWNFQVPTAYQGGISVYGKKRIPELATDSAATTLDPAYLLAAARAEWYQRMADAARGQASAAAYLQLMNHWQQRADTIRQALAPQLEGARLPVVEGKRRG